MSELDRFFGAMRPFLIGRSSVAEAERELGPSPSGSESLDFYRVLVERNMFKILRDVHRPIRILADRQSPQLWGRLVRGYVTDHPPAHYEPNMFAAKFSDWLAEQRKRFGEIPELFEELADYQWIRHLARQCPDDVGDGFEQRLFVRQYTYDVPKIAAALRRDANAELPGRASVVVLVYRHLRHQDVRTFYPTRPGLAVLARRQGAALPPGFGEFQDLDKAEVEMIEHGIFVPRSDS
jgi:hypothetical protein